MIKIRSKITSPLARDCDVLVKLLFFEDALHYEPLIENIIEEFLGTANLDNSSTEIIKNIDESSTGIIDNNYWARENATEIVTTGTLRTGFFFTVLSFMALLPYDENKIQERSLGLMSEICEFCRVLYFSSEKSFHKCCMEGKYTYFGLLYVKIAKLCTPKLKLLICSDYAKIVPKMPKLFLTGKDKDFLKLRSLSREKIPSVQRIKTLLFNEDGINSINFRATY